MTELPHVLVVLRGSVDGTACAGLASEGSRPKWFTRDAASASRRICRRWCGSSGTPTCSPVQPTSRCSVCSRSGSDCTQSSRSGLAGSPPAAGAPGDQLGGTGGDKMPSAAEARPPSRARFTRARWASSWARSIQRWGEPARRLAADAAPPRRRVTPSAWDPLMRDQIPVEERVADGLPHALADAVIGTRRRCGPCSAATGCCSWSSRCAATSR